MQEQTKSEAQFSHVVQTVTGETEYSVIAFARTLNDPLDYLQSVKADIFEELKGNCEEEYLDFIDRCAEFEKTYDTALTDEDRLATQFDRWTEIDTEYSPVGQPHDAGYSNRQKMQDVWDKDSPVFYNEYNKTSKEVWKRITKADNKNLWIVCEYGNFNFHATEQSGKATLRVRTVTRNVKGVPTPYLSVGAVQINMRTGFVKCGVQSCNHTGQLSYLNPTQQYMKRFFPNEIFEFDKEWAEYQVLRIFEHLGTHGSKIKQFPTFTKPAKMQRDNKTTKMNSRRHILQLQKMTGKR